MTVPAKSRPFFTAPAPSVTVLRSLASTAFGSYGLQLPEGIELEDVHDFDVPGNQLGYVSSLSRAERVGGMARRFIRADVQVTAKDDSDPDVFPDSDVDQVLQGAEDRVSSDFYLGSDINLAGLNGWIPFVHFHVGDLADVDIWGTIVTLPVTRIEPIISDHSIVDFTVHVGDQLISDDEARQAENQTIHRALIQDRRELAGLEATASSAKKTAEQADERSQQTNTGLTGDPDGDVAAAWEDPGTPIGGVKDTADTIDFDLDQAVDLVAQGLEIEVPEGKETRMMFSIAQVLALGIQANTQSIRANATGLLLHENRMKWMRWTQHQQFWAGTVPVDNEWLRLEIFPQVDIRASSVHITPKPGWRGKVTMMARFGSGDMDMESWTVDGSGKTLKHPGGSIAWQYTSALALISPLWGPDPREYVLVVGGDGGFIPNDDYHNYLEWNPIEWNPDEGTHKNSARFRHINVVADQEVLIFFEDYAEYLSMPAGTPIPQNWWFRPVEDSTGAAYKFTEIE